MWGGGLNGYKVFSGKPEGKSPLEDLGIDVILLKKWDGRAWTGFLWL